MHKISKKKLAVTGALAVVLAGSGTAAYAYWTTTGSGSGSGSVKATNGTLALTGTVSNQLAPGESSPVTFTASNPGTSDLYLTSIHLVKIESDKAGCSMADFSMPDVPVGQIIAHGATNTAVSGTGSLSFANTAVSQDACKGAALTLTLSSN